MLGLGVESQLTKLANPVQIPAGTESAHQTSKPSSNPSWDATVQHICVTFNVMRVFTIKLNVQQLVQLQADAAEARSLLQTSK